jgi:outer membrane protein assembly factor BamB
MLFTQSKSSVVGRVAKLTMVALLATSVLSGCESNDENEELKVAELKPINITRHVEVKWREQTGSGVENYFSNLRPAIIDDTIFAAGRKGEVVALNRKTGREIWSTDTREKQLSLWDKVRMKTESNDKLSGGITAAYNNLYIGSENGEVLALSQKDGSIVWRQKVGGEVVAAPEAGEGWIAVTTTAGHVELLHPDTGEKRWFYETDVPALSLRGTSSPTIANGGVLVGTAGGKMMVVVMEQGLPAWDVTVAEIQGSTELERLIDADTKPIVLGPEIYMVAYNGSLVAIDFQSGRINWKRDYSSYRNLTLDKGILFLTDDQGYVTAVEAKTGIEKWSNTDFFNRHLTQPVVYKDTIVVGDFEGYFHFLDAETGQVVSRYKLDDYDYSKFHWFVSWFTPDDRRAYTAPVAKGDLLYVQTRDGELSALRLP